MKKKVQHFEVSAHSEAHQGQANYPFCMPGKFFAMTEGSKDWDRVTCKRCLKKKKNRY